MLRRWAILTGVLLALAGCGGDDEEPTATPTTTEATAGAECVAADSSIMTPLGNKLLVEDGRVRSGFLVESEAAGVYYISAEIDGTGLEDDGDVGTWVTESSGGRRSALRGERRRHGAQRLERRGVGKPRNGRRRRSGFSRLRHRLVASRGPC